MERKGYGSGRGHYGQPVLRTAGGWCVFFNEGCVLHKIGEARGNKFAYKPIACAVFPLVRQRGIWHIRQRGYLGETWDLSCLVPTAEKPLAVETLREELAVAARVR